MSEVILRELTLNDEAAFYQAVKDWKGQELSWITFDWSEGVAFSDHLRRLELNKQGRDLPKGFVANTMFYGFVGAEIFGRVHVRHELNDHLLERGGHIGYAIAPRFRSKGLAFPMVEQVLPYIKDELKLDRMLITCSKDNAPSVRIIERLGGVLENQLSDTKSGEVVTRYWLAL